MKNMKNMNLCVCIHVVVHYSELPIHPWTILFGEQYIKIFVFVSIIALQLLLTPLQENLSLAPKQK